MTKTLGYCILVMALATVLCVSAYAPAWLNDSNEFMKGFVNHEMLAIMGVIVSITLACTAQLHLTMNEIERNVGKSILTNTRAGVKQAATALIVLFVLSLLVVFVKGVLPNESPQARSIVNGLALIIVLWAALILASITETIFAVRPGDEK